MIASSFHNLPVSLSLPTLSPSLSVISLLFLCFCLILKLCSIIFFLSPPPLILDPLLLCFFFFLFFFFYFSSPQPPSPRSTFYSHFVLLQRILFFRFVIHVSCRLPHLLFYTFLIFYSPIYPQLHVPVLFYCQHRGAVLRAGSRICRMIVRGFGGGLISKANLLGRR